MNNNSNHNTVWILGLVVVLVLGVLIGTNMKTPTRVADDQQGAVARTTNTTVYTNSQLKSILTNWATSKGMIAIDNTAKDGIRRAGNTYLANNPTSSDLLITTCVSTNVITGYTVGSSFVVGTYPSESFPQMLGSVIINCFTINYPF